MQLCDLSSRRCRALCPSACWLAPKAASAYRLWRINPTTGDYFTFYRPSPVATAPPAATMAWTPCRRISRTPKTPPWKRPRPIIRSYPALQLIPDSEGAGSYRGGLGVRRDYTFPGHTPSFSILSDKAKYPPWGLFDGGPARSARYILNPDTSEARELPSKITLLLKPGDVVSVQTPGGGGCEAAWKRPADQMVTDVTLGKVSAERALHAYGVVLDPTTFTLDEAATAEARTLRCDSRWRRPTHEPLPLRHRYRRHLYRWRARR